MLPRTTIFVTVILLINGYLAYPYPSPRLNDTHGQDDMHTLDRRSSIRHSLTSRATLEVIWSCLATTISCTYPNIPFFDHPNRGRRLWLTTNRALCRLFLMLQALLFPEVIVTWAYRQYLASGEMSRGVNAVLANSSSSS